jgi:hypothetical protein
MGTYLSLPFVAKKTVACEPATKQDSTEQSVEVIKTEVKEEIKTEMNTEIKEIAQELVKTPVPVEESVVMVEDKKDITAMKEEEKEEEKTEEEKKEEEKQKLADQSLKECMEIEAMIAKVSVMDLKIKIPEEENTIVARAPEFRNQIQSESHAVKKFNKKHRKN